MKRLSFFISILFLAQQMQAQTANPVRHYSFSLSLSDSSDIIEGDATLIMSVGGAVAIELTSVNAAGKGMNVKQVLENGRPINFVHARDSIFLQLQTVNSNAYDTVRIIYAGIPADGLVISKTKYGNRSFFSDNWPNRAHNWIPCIDRPSAKSPVSFAVTAPAHYQVVSNGWQVEETNLPNGLKVTRYEESTALPTKIMVIGVADFAVGYSGTVSCIPITSWVYPEDRTAGFEAYSVAKDILPFFIERIGPYAYRKLANVESKTIFGGMENASAIFYPEDAVLVNNNMESVIAHEIAHQWFGNSATEQSWPHIWLSEGFATFMSYAWMQHKYGIDTVRKGRIKDRLNVFDFARKKNTPVVDSSITSNFMQLLNRNSYEKGGWILHMLNEKLGDTTFWKGIRYYYTRYAGGNATTDDFRRCMEEVSGKDLRNFFAQWLYRPGNPIVDVSWKYNEGKKRLSMHVSQQQTLPYQLSLLVNVVYGADTISKIIDLTSKETEVSISVPVKPTQIVLDPKADLLFEARLHEAK